jgi:ABC-type transporter Mla subunit MlaD
MSSSRFGKFVCPECLESFGSGENLNKHFTGFHGSKWSESDDNDDDDDDGKTTSSTALPKAPLEWAAGLEQQKEAKLLRSTLLELGEMAIEQPLNALAVFAEGLGVLDETLMEGLDNLADNISHNNAQVRIAPLVQHMAGTDEKLSRLIADLDQAASVTVQRGAEAIDEATAAIGGAIGDGAAGFAQAAVKAPLFLGWRAAAATAESSKKNG